MAQVAPKKRDRKANFTEREMSVLLEEIQERRDALMSKFCSALTLKQKKVAWAEVNAKLNAISTTPRTVDEVRKKWHDLKTSALAWRRELLKTGGGPLSKPPPFIDIILAIIGHKTDSLSGITVDGSDYGFTTERVDPIESANIGGCGEGSSCVTQMTVPDPVTASPPQQVIDEDTTEHNCPTNTTQLFRKRKAVRTGTKYDPDTEELWKQWLQQEVVVSKKKEVLLDLKIKKLKKEMGDCDSD